MLLQSMIYIETKLNQATAIRMVVVSQSGHIPNLQNKHLYKQRLLVHTLLRRLDFHLVVHDNLNVNQVLHIFCYWRQPVPFIVNN